MSEKINLFQKKIQKITDKRAQNYGIAPNINNTRPQFSIKQFTKHKNTDKELP